MNIESKLPNSNCPQIGECICNISINNRGGYVWVEFKGHRRMMFGNPLEFPFQAGDLAIVEADRGEDAGIVRHTALKSAFMCDFVADLNVIRRGNDHDMERIAWLREREQQVEEICKQKAEYHQLPMNLVDAEYRFDGQKLLIYFTSSMRIDFRDLVRDLAATFRTRIELRQIGSRDEARRGEGYGICGRELCCVTHLNNFYPITTIMAKSQHLILNPSKLSGICGKLKCCLHYEYAEYCKIELDRLESVFQFDENTAELESLSD